MLAHVLGNVTRDRLDYERVDLRATSDVVERPPKPMDGEPIPDARSLQRRFRGSVYWLLTTGALSQQLRPNVHLGLEPAAAKQ